MRRVVDLTLPLERGERGYARTPARTLERDGWNASTFELYSHCGTHVDAPCHFLPSGPGLESLSLDALVGPALLVDLTPIAPRERITPGHLGARRDAVGPGSRLLLRTDWSRRHGTPQYRDELPRISAELASWLVERGVALLGVEPPSVADVHRHDELAEVHRILLEGGVVIVEGLAALDALRSSRFELVVLPLRIPGADGSPARAIAIETDDDTE